MSELSSSLHAGSCLIGSTSTPQSDLKGALLQRLQKYYTVVGTDSPVDETCTLQEVQLRTALEALSVVERVQQLIVSTEIKDGEPPLLGVRDLSQLRMLISIVFRWATEPLLSNLVSVWPEKHSATTSNTTKIIDLTSTPEDYHHLSDITTRMLRLIFPSGPQQKTSITLITETVISRHLKELLEPSIALGWLPRSLATDSMTPLDDARPLVTRLISSLPVSQSIAALGGVMSSRGSVLHIRRACGFFLSRQLLRPDGIQGLFAAVFGEAEGDDTKLEQLEHVSRVLTTIPSNQNSKDYFSVIIPRLIGLLHDEKHVAYRRASAFTISRLLDNNADPAVVKFVLSALHTPFLAPKPTDTDASQFDYPEPISTLSVLLVNSDPSPRLITTLLGPVVAQLYALLYYLESSKTADPTVKETVRNMLLTWFRVSSVEEAVAILLFIVNDKNGRLELGLDGEIRRPSQASEPLSLFTPESLNEAEEAGELELGGNWLDVYPDPTHYANFMKSINRQDVASDLFVVILEAYRDIKRGDGDPIQTLSYLQIIMQMQEMLTQDSKLGGFTNPTQILVFIKQVLEEANPATSRPPENRGSNHISGIPTGLFDRMNIGESNHVEDEDSDDDMEDSEKRDSDTETTETALNLLLSVLEGNKSISTKTMPVLNDILVLLEPLLSGDTTSSSVRELAREARIVLTARLASQNMNSTDDEDSPEKDTQRTYQQALKFLQDPILPLRAHGLLLLRQLVSDSSKPVDPALIPAIHDIFIQSVQDNDSYIFLNAVQGLAALVDRVGEHVLKRMLNDYGRGFDGLEGGNMSQQDVDIRLRLGEAIGSVIQRCGSALASYGNVIVVSLLKVLGSKNAPTTVKTSALSLLAECQKTYSLVLFPFFTEISESMLDIIQLEGQTTEMETPIDDNPTTKNSKFPPLRRAALHLLSLLLKGTAENIYDTSFGRTHFSPELIRRTKITLSYAAETDGDAVVRVMAREALELVKQLGLAIFDIRTVG